jgi:hypothetical protein
MHEGLRSLLIAVSGLVAGAGLLVVFVMDDAGQGIEGVLGAVMVLLGAYLLLGYFRVRLIVSRSGLEIPAPSPPRRAKELAWTQVSSVVVHPSKYFVTFVGADGTRINVGPGAVYWDQLVALAISELPKDINAPLRAFQGHRRPGAV